MITALSKKYRRNISSRFPVIFWSGRFRKYQEIVKKCFSSWVMNKNVVIHHNIPSLKCSDFITISTLDTQLSRHIASLLWKKLMNLFRTASYHDDHHTVIYIRLIFQRTRNISSRSFRNLNISLKKYLYMYKYIWNIYEDINSFLMISDFPPILNRRIQNGRNSKYVFSW